MSSNTVKWPKETFGDLRKLIAKLHAKTEKGQSPVAWRGLANAEWKLQSTLDRVLVPGATYPDCVERELRILEEFRKRAWQFASKLEKAYLNRGLKRSAVWDVMAIGRHHGLPTRALDWTESPWVAAYFACIEPSDADAVIWWFNQTQLENILERHWDCWGVPTMAEAYGYLALDPAKIKRLRLHERALEKKAFKDGGPTWITKLHYPLPFPRMEAQQGFMTICSHIRKNHDDAIDKLAEHGPIERGCIIIPKALKHDVLEELEHLDVNAQSLKYPGLDYVAAEVKAESRRCAESHSQSADHYE